MSRIRNYAAKNELPLHRVVLTDYADLQAAKQLELAVTEEKLQGQQLKICFSSTDKAEARAVQERVNNLASSLRMPPGTDPAAEGAAIKAERVSKHAAHQTKRRIYTQEKDARRRERKRRY